MELTALEVAEILRKGISGELPVRLGCSSRTWDGTFAGDVEFLFGDWHIVIFNDCDEVDYVDSATAPDGRKWDIYQYDGADSSEPIEGLTRDEVAALEQRLKDAS